MSSATSTDGVRVPALGSPEGKPDTANSTLQPWQFFVLAALGCASAVSFLVRGQGITAVILLSVLIGATVWVGLAALRMLRPLLGEHEEMTAVVGQRTRTALAREKHLTLRAIKDLEFDRAMGKISEEDFKEMSARLRERAGRLIKALDAGAGYREQVEQELARRMAAVRRPSDIVETGAAVAGGSVRVQVEMLLCASCSTTNDVDARFCKGCGAKL